MLCKCRVEIRGVLGGKREGYVCNRSIVVGDYYYCYKVRENRESERAIIIYCAQRHYLRNIWEG